MLLLGGCAFHRGSGFASDAAGDGAPGDVAGDTMHDGATDARPDAPPESCLARWRDGTIDFSSPVKLASLNSPQLDRDPFLTADELTVYFSSERGTVGNGDIYTATRQAIGMAFSAPTLFAAGTTTGYDSKLSMTDNGELFVVANDQPGTKGGPDIWQSGRSSTANAWGALDESHEGNVDTAVSELDPAMSPDGLHLYLSVGTGIQHIGLSTRPSTSMNFSAPVTINEIDNTVGEADPAISADETIIVFSSGRTGANKMGTNLWYATRATVNDAFGAPVPVPTVNTDTDEADAFLSRDGCRLYFGNDANGYPDFEIWVATAN